MCVYGDGRSGAGFFMGGFKKKAKKIKKKSLLFIFLSPCFCFISIFSAKFSLIS